MATDIENLEARRTAVIQQLADLASGKAGFSPNSTASGVDHVAYRDSLYRELESLNSQIAILDGPQEYNSQGFST